VSPGVAQDAFANIGVSMLTMVNMLAGGVDLTMFNGVRPRPSSRRTSLFMRQPRPDCKFGALSLLSSSGDRDAVLVGAAVC